MAKVIVPKNCVYNYNLTVSGITASNLIGSTYTTNFQLMPESMIDDGILGFNVTINYGMSNSTINIPWTSYTLKYITIKNSKPFDCNFIFLTINNLPKITNTGSVPGSLTIRLELSDGTYIDLNSPGAKPGETITIPNQTYYVDLVNKTATISKGAANLAYNYNKAIIYNDSYWLAPKELYTNNNVTNSYTITPKNPFPYIFNNIEFRGPNYSGTNQPLSVSTSTFITININTSNNPSYIFLDLVGLPTIKNTSSGAVQVALYVNISGVSIMIDSTNLNSGFIVNLKETAICIDAINKKLIYDGRSSSNINLQKAITHL